MELSNEYRSYDELPLFLNTETVTKIPDVSPSSRNELTRVIASFVSFVPPQAAGLIHSAAPPFPTKPKDGFVGTLSNFPVHKVGSRRVVPKEKFVDWAERHIKKWVWLLCKLPKLLNPQNIFCETGAKTALLNVLSEGKF